MKMGCLDCIYCVEGLRDDRDNLCVACIKMPSNEVGGCGYLEIDGIDYTKERMWFCPLEDHWQHFRETNNERWLRGVCKDIEQ